MLYFLLVSDAPIKSNSRINDGVHALAEACGIIGNQVKLLNSPAAVMTSKVSCPRFGQPLDVC